MGGLLLIGLLIELWDLLSPLWPFLLGAVAVYVIWRWVLLPKWEAEARAAREQMRHERARREIDRIAIETSRAMYDAALGRGEVIEGTAVEVDRS
jgi:hypothetical protein